MKYDVLIVSIVLAALLVLVTLKKKAFTPAAAITAAVILIVAGICGEYAAIVGVLSAYGIVFAVDMILGKRTERITGEINKKTGRRDIVQVLANALAAVIALVLGYAFSRLEGLVIYYVALTECLADSLASDVGVLSKKDPVDICRMKRIKRGLSGGVSLLGTVSALIGCIAMTLISFIFLGFNLKYFLAILVVPMIGIVVDSLLGSLLQSKHQCVKCGKFTEKDMHCGEPTRHCGGVKFINNDMVNILSNFASAVIAALFLLL